MNISNFTTTDRNKLVTVAHNVLPLSLRRALLWIRRRANRWRMALHLARLRRRMFSSSHGANRTERLLDYTVRIHNGPIFYYLYEDIFVNHIYHFESQRPDPLILDCGSNVGLSILYFKHIYPQARVVGFDPDPAIFPCLQENITRNGLADVQLVQAALGTQETTLTFHSDGKIGSRLVENPSENIPQGWTKYEVPCVRLRDYLTEPVDFLKINIEGAEWEVLADSEDRLHQVREMVVEYHHMPGAPRTLHKILALLHRQGFEYLVSDFGLDGYRLVKPPIHLCPETFYCRLIYARRM